MTEQQSWLTGVLADARAIEHSITLADLDIEDLKDKTKTAKELRERLVAELRDTVKRIDEPMLVDAVEKSSNPT